MEIFTALITASSTIICAIIARIAQKEHKQAEIDRAKAESRSQQRMRESQLMLQLIHADCSLTVGTALAVKRGKANGELEQGLKDVEVAMSAYDDFHDEIALNHLTKEI